MYFYIFTYICVISSNIYQVVLLIVRMSQFNISIILMSHFYEHRHWETLFTLTSRWGHRSFVMTMSRADKKENWDIFLGYWLQRAACNDSIAYEYKPYVKISSQSTIAGNLKFICQKGWIWQSHSILWTPWVIGQVSLRDLLFLQKLSHGEAVRVWRQEAYGNCAFCSDLLST